MEKKLLEDIVKCLKMLGKRNTASYEKLQKATKKANKIIEKIENEYLKK